MIHFRTKPQRWGSEPLYIHRLSSSATASTLSA